MDAFRKFRPLGKWLWNKIPEDERLAVEAKLFREAHHFVLGEYDETIEILGGELRGRIEHRENYSPHLAEDGMTIILPKAMIQKLLGQERIGLHDLMACEGLPDITISRIKRVDRHCWLEFERTGQQRRKAA